MIKNKKEVLGQFFTPVSVVDDMIGLVKNSGAILEPSAGDGAFVNRIGAENITAIEIDKNLAKKNHYKNMDFFDYPEENKFDTIIGNPPYVKYNCIDKKTKKKISKYNKLFDGRSNLYLFFIYKSIKHLKDNGELIFIVPRDFLKATSAIKLNKYIYENGTITDLVELGDKKIFEDAVPNTIIFRFQKNNFNRKTNLCKKFLYNKGQLLFTKNKYTIKFNDLFYVKVGAVSGSDKIFENNKYGNQDFVCSYTKKKNKTKKMIFNTKIKYLDKFKQDLISRKIKNFDETNWWQWGRLHHISSDKRIYVNQKTRDKKPFFIYDNNFYDGSILAIFPKGKVSAEKLSIMKNALNNVDWEDLGFVVDGRLIFSQKSLENSYLPNTFKQFLN